MALTKEKLITHLETQLGIGRQESRHVIESLLKIMQETLSRGEDLLISGLREVLGPAKKGTPGKEPSN